MNNKGLMWKRALAWFLDIFIITIVNTALSFLLIYLEAGTFLRFAVYILILLIYFVGFEASTMAATPGKIIFRLWICYEKENLRFVKSLARLLVGIVTGVPLGFGFFYGAFSKKGDTIADLAFNSSVVTHLPGSRRTLTPCIYKIKNNKAEFCCEISGGGVVFGRDPRVCGVLFASNVAGISRSHCIVKFNEQTLFFMLEDLSSSYGTFLGNGERVRPHKIKMLDKNQKFYLAHKKNMFCVGFKEDIE